MFCGDSALCTKRMSSVLRLTCRGVLWKSPKIRHGVADRGSQKDERLLRVGTLLYFDYGIRIFVENSSVEWNITEQVLETPLVLGLLV